MGLLLLAELGPIKKQILNANSFFDNAWTRKKPGVGAVTRQKNRAVQGPVLSPVLRPVCEGLCGGAHGKMARFSLWDKAVMVIGRWWVRRWVGCTVAASLLCALAWPGRAGLVDFSEAFLSSMARQWGRDAVPRLTVWQRLVRDNTAAGVAPARVESTSLRQVNGFFNQVPYLTDQQHWRVEDYWATPAEMLGSFGGDCEDYSISKYLSLREMGVPIEKLRITYVRALSVNESHMVLAYYPTPDAEPLILDNLNGTILPASQRPDLEPVYSFNDDDLWVQGGASRKGGASNVRLWRNLLQKLAKEQAI